jgi:hypothetical protein
MHRRSGSTSARGALALMCSLALWSCGAVAAGAGEYRPDSTKGSEARRFHLSLESGALVGTESVDLVGYSPVRWRFFAATGFNIAIFPRDSVDRALESVGLEYNVAIGHQYGDKWEARHAVGPGVTWRLSGNWRLHDMAGPVWSSRGGKSGAGLELRNNIHYKNVVSIETLVQTLPVTIEDPRIGSGNVTSYYTGVVFRGKSGGIVLGTAAVVTVVGSVIALFALTQGLKHLG